MVATRTIAVAKTWNASRESHSQRTLTTETGTKTLPATVPLLPTKELPALRMLQVVSYVDALLIPRHYLRVG